ncbi:hypothetical protein LWC34_07755 [Kibdelosporangium philippinense]|uniref:DUF385 domain-containing protein n=1 Tax=Kibdelosporangium philippinense TaxID=211113 RepID=A0ABS8Z7F7_9PSEU|nr:hypothetical protein [Kibdelosporangium philippinense]MCE7002725.1 hypothetical protein [Kibdelosporangium philippinense]
MRLIADATKKSGLIWITRPGETRAVPTWHHWHNNAAYVLVNLSDVDCVTVITRDKATGARAVEWEARVSRVAPGTDEWDTLVPDIHAARLNSAPIDAETPLFRLDPPASEEPTATV